MTRLVIAALAATLWAPAARAQTACPPREAVLKILATRYGEVRHGVGIEQRGGLVEVWASDDGDRTWTVTVSLTDGSTCILASGEAWEDRMDDLSRLQDDES